MSPDKKRVIDLWIVVGTLLALGVYGTVKGVFAYLSSKGIVQVDLATPYSLQWWLSPVLVFLSICALWRKGWARKGLCLLIWITLSGYLVVVLLSACWLEPNWSLGALFMVFVLYLVLIFLQDPQTRELFTATRKEQT